jgi:RimJ/RimL family protein N-acetyltransferase
MFLDLRPTLIGDLVLLRPLELFDFDSLYSVAADPLIWEQLPQSDRYKRDVFSSLFEDWMKPPRSLIAIDRKTNEVIGSSRYYELDEKNSSVAIGYTFLARSRWGLFFNREMKKLMLDHAFTSVRTVIFHIATCNIRSQKAAEKIGAKFITIIEKEFNGIRTTYCIYEITKHEFTSRISAT